MKHNYSFSFKFTTKYGVLVYLLLFLSFPTFSQYYPGGLSNTNLQIWLDANDASSVNVPSAGKVNSWDDKSGNVVDIIQGTSTKYPTYSTTAGVLNGYHYVQANPSGSDAYSTNTNLSAASTVNELSTMTMLAVATPSTVTPAYNYAAVNPIFWWGKETGNWGQVAMSLSTSSPYFAWRFGTGTANSDVLYTPSSVTSTTAYVMSAAKNGATEKGYFNGLAIATPTTGSLTGKTTTIANTTSQFYIGQGQGGGQVPGDQGTGAGGNNKTGEITIYNTYLNNSQIVILQNYLAAKWGVTLDASTRYFTPPTSTTYNYNLIGVGRISLSDYVTSTVSGDGLGISLASTPADNGDFIMAAHTNPNPSSNANYVTLSSVTSGITATTNLTGTSPTIAERWADEWYIVKSGAFTGAPNITISFDAAGYFGTGNYTNFVTAANYKLLNRATSGTTNYTVLAQSASVSGHIVSFTLTASALSTGYYTLGTTTSTTSPLPIELLSFNASSCNNEVCLNWSTASEKNNDYFTIEKTKDAVNYDFVTKIAGAGNSTALREYSTEDNAPFEGISYYRLKQTDYNGNYTYSNLSQVDFDPTSSSFSFNVYPNPSSGDNITSNFNSDKGIEVLVKIYDATGREVYSKIIVAEQKGMNAFVLDASTKLAPGIYMITATSNGNFQSKKLIVK